MIERVYSKDEKKVITIMLIYLIIACLIPFMALVGIPVNSAMILSGTFLFFSLLEIRNLKAIWDKQKEQNK